jgi:ABC-type antimicrobial peptide transport system permease subunit
MPKNKDEKDNNNNDDNDNDDKNGNNDNNDNSSDNHDDDRASLNGLKRHIQEKTRGLVGMRGRLKAVGNNFIMYYVKWHQQGCKEEG